MAVRQWLLLLVVGILQTMMVLGEVESADGMVDFRDPAMQQLYGEWLDEGVPYTDDEDELRRHFTNYVSKRFSEFVGGKRFSEFLGGKKRFSEFLGGKKRFSEFLGGKKRFSEFLGGKKRFSEFLGGKKRFSEFLGGKKRFSEFIGGKRDGHSEDDMVKRDFEFLGGR